MDGLVAIYIFMLAAFTGYEVISRVPVILHTPLMSGSNFVHGVVLVGGMIALGQAGNPACSRPSALSPCCWARPMRPAATW
jgi:NAD(P) transhydrogenase subunit alpha